MSVHDEPCVLDLILSPPWVALDESESQEPRSGAMNELGERYGIPRTEGSNPCVWSYVDLGVTDLPQELSPSPMCWKRCVQSSESLGNINPDHRDGSV